MGNEAKVKVGGIMAASGLATVSILSLPDRPDVPGMILHAMGGRNINIEFVVHNVDIEGNGNMTFCIDQKNLESAIEVLEGVKPLIEAKGISYHPNVATISVFGPHFRERPMISGLMFNALGTAGINVMAISTSISSCSCVVEADQIENAVRVLHETFEAPHQVTKFAP
ncbi:MAG: ACT domain-containing protein [Deltaproteobacteria bacterium]|nr:ACT domain-containing protein [Deltaproteobacteria bacterium]MBM4325472.1 ACT domain-containing protein [Deltaproteobacteria bacterium]MBM4348036.1 ACT domain-containing protein [Deltaproteobacteria bacterium]